MDANAARRAFLFLFNNVPNIKDVTVTYRISEPTQT